MTVTVFSIPPTPSRSISKRANVREIMPRRLAHTKSFSFSENAAARSDRLLDAPP